MISFVTQAGEKTTKSLGKALIHGSQRGMVWLVETTLKRGANVDYEFQNQDDAFTALYVASQNGHNEVVKMLLRAGANPERVGARNGWTPLFVACVKGHAETVRLLLEHAVDLNCPSPKTGASTIMVASNEGHVEVVELLLAAAASTDKEIRAPPQKSPHTALQLACEAGHVRVVEIMLKAGADTENAKSAAFLPLNISAQKGYTEIVKLLLEAGADRSKVDLSKIPNVSDEIKMLFERVAHRAKPIVEIGPPLGPCHLFPCIRKMLVAELVDEDAENAQQRMKKYNRK